MVKKASAAIRAVKPKTVKDAVTVARRAFGKVKPSAVTRVPRVISVSGGVLPLLPLFSALGMIGSLGTAASSIVKTIKDVQNGKKMLEEAKRHNKSMEEVQVGHGLFLKQYKKGYGLYIKRKPKN